VSPTRPRSLLARPFPSGVLAYGFTALAVGVSVGIMLALRSAGVGSDASSALLLAVVVGFLYGGVGPGVFALALSGLVARDAGMVAIGAILGLVCEIFRRAVLRSRVTVEPMDQEETVPRTVSPSPFEGRTGRQTPEVESTTPPLREVTTEATWRFHHTQPLDITLPEDEQIEHLYLYSVLAECNDAFARMYGFRTAADVVGTQLVVFLSPSNPANVEYLRSFIRSGYRLEDANSQEIDRYGRAKYFVNNLVGIFERGQLVGAWGTQRDVTELRQDSSQEYRSRLHSSNSSSQ
jgi:PAS domain